jgi:hypothetical protein
MEQKHNLSGNSTEIVEESFSSLSPRVSGFCGGEGADQRDSF